MRGTHRVEFAGKLVESRVSCAKEHIRVKSLGTPRHIHQVESGE